MRRFVLACCLFFAAAAIAETWQVNLAWQPPASSADPVAGYNLYRQAPGGGYTLLNSSGPVTGTAFVDPAVSTGLSYSYYVESVDAQGNPSGPSNTVIVSIPNVEASGLSVAQSGSNAVLSWGTPADSPASANVYRSFLWGPFERIATGVTPNGPYTDATATVGLWFYFVTFVSSSGVESKWSNTASLTLAP